MPDISGWNVLEKIRYDKVLRGMQVVMMSGPSSRFDIEKATLNGVQGSYTKPHTRSDYGDVATNLKTSFLDLESWMREGACLNCETAIRIDYAQYSLSR